VKHEHSDIFELLRSEQAMEDDGTMAMLIADEGKGLACGSASAAGRRYAHSVAVDYALDGVRFLYRWLRFGNDMPLDEGERPQTEHIIATFEAERAKSADPMRFKIGAEMFCECSGVTI
jgi:hypothetical protein